MDGILEFFLLPALPGLAALALGLLLKRSARLGEQRYLLPALALSICYLGFALLDCFYWSGFDEIRILLALSVPLAVGLLAGNRHIVMFGSLLLWIVSVFLNAPLSMLIDPHPGLGWTLLGFLISFEGFFFVLTTFAWHSWGRQLHQ